MPGVDGVADNSVRTGPVKGERTGVPVRFGCVAFRPEHSWVIAAYPVLGGLRPGLVRSRGDKAMLGRRLRDAVLYYLASLRRSLGEADGTAMGCCS